MYLSMSLCDKAVVTAAAIFKECSEVLLQQMYLYLYLVGLVLSTFLRTDYITATTAFSVIRSDRSSWTGGGHWDHAHSGLCIRILIRWYRPTVGLYFTAVMNVVIRVSSTIPPWATLMCPYADVPHFLRAFATPGNRTFYRIRYLMQIRRNGFGCRVDITATDRTLDIWSQCIHMHAHGLQENVYNAVEYSTLNKARSVQQPRRRQNCSFYVPLCILLYGVMGDVVSSVWRRNIWMHAGVSEWVRCTAQMAGLADDDVSEASAAIMRLQVAVCSPLLWPAVIVMRCTVNNYYCFRKCPSDVRLLARLRESFSNDFMKPCRIMDCWYGKPFQFWG